MIPTGTLDATHLWQTYLDLPSLTHAYLAGAMADLLIKSDPEAFARLMAEAEAAA